MGTEFRIVVYGPDSLAVAAAVDTAFNRVAELNDIMSDYLPGSEINRLSERSGSGESVAVSEDLWRVMVFAQRVAEESNGAFDVTAGRLTRLWRRAIRRGVIPDSTDILDALKTVGYEYVELDSTSTSPRIRLGRRGVRLDLGGIAKGFAVDEAFAVLLETGYSRILVDGGGDMRIGDPPPDLEAWTITITGVDSDDSKAARLVHLANTALAQSGATYRFVEHDGVRYSHIVDPRTGYGMTDGRIVTAAAPTCMEADVLASALSVTSPSEEEWLAQQHPNAVVHIDRLPSETLDDDVH